jgi:thiosulfate dehydrogenase
MANEADKNLVKVISQLTNLIIFLLLLLLALGIMLAKYLPPYVPAKEIKKESSTSTRLKTSTIEKIDTVNYWKAPDEASLNDVVNKEQILYGKDIIAHTSDYFGTNGKIFKSSTNGMNCQNCHLEAGTKIYGNNYSAVASTYPKFRARSGAIEDMYKRVNDCFERSLNGKALDTNSKEMQGIIAYLKWLGKDVKKGEKPAGSGFKDLAFLDRAASPENGEKIYSEKCASCHQIDGLGMLNGDKTAFTYPPLWGKNSYNDGAGLFRLSNFAKYTIIVLLYVSIGVITILVPGLKVVRKSFYCT